MRLQAGEQVLAPVPVRLERVVEHRRASAQPLLDHAVTGAELGLKHARPAHLPGEALAFAPGHEAPGVRVAVTEDRAHHARS